MEINATILSQILVFGVLPALLLILPLTSAHSLRHSHASNLLMNNCPLIQVSHRLGHADASITLKVYSHFLEELTVDFDKYLPKIHA